jgi:hypothetical protein
VPFKKSASWSGGRLQIPKPAACASASAASKRLEYRVFGGTVSTRANPSWRRRSLNILLSSL